MKHYDKCKKLYDKDGQSAVFDYANKHDDIKWGECKPCEAVSPVEENTCLVCGSHIEDFRIKSSNKRIIADHNLEAIILKDIKEMDGDVYEGLIEYMYGVRVINNGDETYTLEPHDMDENIEDVFGDNIKLFEKE